MPSWEDLMNCVCQNGPQRPGVQEVIDTLQRSTVCTGTQCFETEADAFGLQTPAAANDDSMFFMMMMYAAGKRAGTRETLGGAWALARASKKMPPSRSPPGTLRCARRARCPRHPGRQARTRHHAGAPPLCRAL